MAEDGQAIESTDLIQNKSSLIRAETRASQVD